MAKSSTNFSSGYGKLTHGPQANALVDRTLDFVRDELPGWRDDKDRKVETDEEALNAQLCKYLNSRARQLPLPVLFHHEEKQTQRRRVDISAGPAENGFSGQIYQSIYDPFLVFEGKRLPPPGGKAREREYVTGEELFSGGVQRFKLGMHGALINTAAMIGYIQEDDSSQWFKRINEWIIDLQNRIPIEYGVWTKNDCLKEFASDKKRRTANCMSYHTRTSSPIKLLHFWVEMNCKK